MAVGIARISKLILFLLISHVVTIECSFFWKIALISFFPFSTLLGELMWLTTRFKKDPIWDQKSK